LDKTVNYGFDLISNCEMFTPREHDFLGKIFLSLGSPGGTLVLNENVIFLIRFQMIIVHLDLFCVFRVVI